MTKTIFIKIIILLNILFLTGCSKNNYVDEKNTGMYLNFNINVNVKNKDAKNDEYLVFLLPKGEKQQKVGEATTSYGVGTMEVKKNSTLNIDLTYKPENINELKDLSANELIEYVLNTYPDSSQILNNLMDILELLEYLEDKDLNTKIELFMLNR